MIFKAKNGEIFNSDISFENKGWRYVVREVPSGNFMVIKASTLATLGEAHDFIAENLHNYPTSNLVAELDDLDCLINDECSLDKLSRLTEIYGSDPAIWKMRHREVFEDLLEEAIENYKYAEMNGK